MTRVLQIICLCRCIIYMAYPQRTAGRYTVGTYEDGELRSVESGAPHMLISVLDMGPKGPHVKTNRLG